MDKKLLALIGAVAGVATVGSAKAAVETAPATSAAPASYADLLAPIDNPVQQLQADDAARAAKDAGTQTAQYYPYGYPYYRYYHHHHHHHHHHGVVFGPGGVYVR